MSRGEIRVTISSDQDIVLARQKGRSLALELGFSSGDATLIATAISELARNIVSYAIKGEVALKGIQGSNRVGILVIASDNGPGIPDIRQALRDGFSTSGSLGLGLPGVRRLMDEFEIVSKPGQGTTIGVKKWRP
ncbi:MAG: ATP-binding protein [Acidobacteria bacterium]|nr:MAG: ATP-binding protein [Acidobacteriota bacterium]